MFDGLKSIPDKIKNMWQGLNEKKKSRIIVLAIVFIIGLSSLVALINQKNYVVMYSGLDVYEAGEIYSKLVGLGANVKMQGDNNILIDKKQQDQYRMTLAAEGYPKSGFNYDIYKDNVSVGVSDSEKNTYMIFQLQDRLQNTIKTLRGVNGAIVTISYPEDDLFVLANERKSITASIVVDVGGSTSLSLSQIQAIENLVCGSISGLEPDKVAIIDTNMNILNTHSTNDIGQTSERYSLESALESDYEKQILSVVEPIFGFDNVKVAASIDMNFDKISQETTEYTPINDEDGIISTINEIKEQLVTTDLGTTVTDSNKTEIAKDYQINKQFKVLEYEQGKIEAINVSILINSEEIDQEILDNVTKLAANAVGIEEKDVFTKAMKFVEKIDLENVVNNANAQKASGVFADTQFLLSIIAIVFGFILSVIIVLTLKGGEKNMKSVKKQKGTTVIMEGEETEIDVIERKRDPGKGYQNEINKYVEKDPEGVAGILKNIMAEE